jgi:beta-galactosidase
MRYGKSNGWLDNQPAAITRAVGKGRITYIGAVLDDKSMDVATGWMIAKSGVVPALGPVPDGVEVCRRKGARSQVFVLINFGPEAQRVTLPRSMHAVLASRDEKELELTRYGVEVLLDRTP